MGHLKLTGTNAMGAEVEAVIHDDILIYGEAGARTVDPTTLSSGDVCCPQAGGCRITLTADPEVI